MRELVTARLALEALRVLGCAWGPLTVQDVQRQLGEQHRAVLSYADVYNALQRLVKHGDAATRCDSFPGHGASRIYWPTSKGAQHGDDR